MDDETLMDEALRAAASVQGLTAPNPWVGCVLTTADGATIVGRTHPAGGPHAEADALAQVGGSAPGGTLHVTLEPCDHHGRTPPCTEAILAAGIARVVVAMADPDPRVGGRGFARLRDAGVEVVEGVGRAAAEALLAPYVHHRTTGRPYVVLKLAATLDGRTAAPDASSRWITGPQARADVHRLRASSDAILVGAGTVRADDPELTVRGVESPLAGVRHDPLRVVLGAIPDGARILPALSLAGDLGDVLDELGRRGVLQLMVEGGAAVAGELHRRGFVDRYVIYLAPALFGGDDARPLMTGPGAPTIDDVWRGRLDRIERLGDDLRLDLVPASPSHAPTTTETTRQEAFT